MKVFGIVVFLAVAAGVYGGSLNSYYPTPAPDNGGGYFSHLLNLPFDFVRAVRIAIRIVVKMLYDIARDIFVGIKNLIRDGVDLIEYSFDDLIGANHGYDYTIDPEDCDGEVTTDQYGNTICIPIVPPQPWGGSSYPGSAYPSSNSRTGSSVYG